MPYRLLVPQLSPVADGVAAFLKREWGVRGLKVEKSVYREIKPIPTFHAPMPDLHTLWVEVSNRAYPTHLDGIVADCMQQGLPVRLVVAVPSGLRGKAFHEDFSRARSKGVGVIAVEGNEGQVLANALSLSLAGVHPISKREFPAKFRYALAQAEGTFKGGNPAKGCDDLYAIIEDVSRKIAKVTHAAGFWRASSAAPSFDKGPWDTVMQSLTKNLDVSKCNYFGDNILHRIIGVTPFRNKVVHIVKTSAELRARDRMLRTRFEDAANILLELVTDARPLKL